MRDTITAALEVIGFLTLLTGLLILGAIFPPLFLLILIGALMWVAVRFNA